MKYLIISILVLVSISCSSSSENKNKRKKNLNVLVISFNTADLTPVAGWSNHMPNYNIQTHYGANPVMGAQLDSQDVVILFSNSLRNTQSIGDSVYNYVMNGGHAVLGTFYSQQASGQNNGFDFGKLETIAPTFHNKSAYRNDTLIVDVDHPVLAGIDTLITYYGGGADSLQNGGQELLTWKNGETLLALNEPEGRLFDLSVFAAETRFGTVLKTASNANNLENFYRLWSNMIRYAHSLDHYDDDFNYTPPVDNEGGGEIEAM